MAFADYDFIVTPMLLPILILRHAIATLALLIRLPSFFRADAALASHYAVYVI